MMFGIVSIPRALPQAEYSAEDRRPRRAEKNQALGFSSFWSVFPTPRPQRRWSGVGKTSLHFEKTAVPGDQLCGGGGFEIWRGLR